MNDFSNTLHTDLDDLKAEAEKIEAEIESGASTLLSDVKTVLTTMVDDAGPVLMAAASAGVSAALGSATGGLSAIADAGLAAASAILSSQGVTLAENGLTQLKTLVLGNVLKSDASPTVGQEPGSGPVQTAPVTGVLSGVNQATASNPVVQAALPIAS